VIDLATAIVDRGPWERLTAYELIACHRHAFAALTPVSIRRLARGLDELKTYRSQDESLVRLTADLVSVKLLVWFASVGRDAELRPEAHLYFADRYQRLAELHRRRGRFARASRLQARAEEHHAAVDPDGPPYAAAMAMPRPARFVRTRAVAADPGGTPDDAA
jgi:hypothetical protein